MTRDMIRDELAVAVGLYAFARMGVHFLDLAIAGHRFRSGGWCGCRYCKVEPIEEREHGESGA